MYAWFVWVLLGRCSVADFEASRTRFLIPHFTLSPLFAFLSSGAVDKMVLPEGMQNVNFSYCDGLTPTAGYCGGVTGTAVNYE